MNTKEEKSILTEIKNGEYKSVENLDLLKDKYRAIGENTLKRDIQVNINLSEGDLASLQRKAMSEGIPYQTFISSLLHKYINGSLVEANS